MHVCAWFLACGIVYTGLIFLKISLTSVYLLISFLRFSFSIPHMQNLTPPPSILRYFFFFFFSKLNSLPHQRAPTPRWPSVWRPTIECTTWWLRHLRPCVSGWMSWSRALKDTCISWCSRSPTVHRTRFLWWTLCHTRRLNSKNKLLFTLVEVFVAHSPCSKAL